MHSHTQAHKVIQSLTKLSVCEFVTQSVNFALIEMLTHLKKAANRGQEEHEG